ncbi:hypothetical protein FIBSPDRAFT_956424 [Athelia psychrophila]|uniref:DUF6532 domain-containing protein n=1 Tax=Athelia psychrophila TaxID=1759441 RepID=A0A166GWY5_9AGAM|nr:hypothetical protein FIBSPDRAFT_956424 [Fibularhizoctonia sp. CBS 109695]
MSDSENQPPTRSPRKRTRSEVDTSNVTPSQGKKNCRASKKQKDINQAQAADDIRKMERALKKMKKDLKKTETGETSTRDEDDIEPFESEEEDTEPISSFRHEARHIDTTMSPARRLAPASASRHPNLALASITNTSAPNYHFGDGDEEDEDLGNPTTATTTSPSPRTTPYYHDHFDTPTPSPSAFNIRGRPSDDTRTKSPQPEIARWKNGLSPDDGSKPCASDYTDDVKRIILKACGRYEVFIVTENVFPDHDIQSAKAQDYFTEACQTVGAKYEVTDRITGIIKARGSRIRGVIRSCARFRGDAAYHFVPQAATSKGIRRNKKLAEALLEDDCFCWTIAFQIKQYDRDGVVSHQQFSEVIVKELYDAYLQKVEDWANLDPTVTLKLRERSYRRAVRFGGASVTAVKGMSPEAKLRAQMALAGRTIDVDAEREEASDASVEI